MSHRADTSGVPYISSVNPSAVFVAGSQQIVVTGNALSPTTEVDIGSLGTITNSVFAHVTSVSQTLTLTVAVAAIPDPWEEVDITCSNGGVTGNTVVVGHGSIIPTTGLSLWLDANDAGTISDSGGDVSEWRNKAPAPYAGIFDFAQSNGTYRPRLVTSAWNGKPVIRFDGVDDHLNGVGATGYRSPAGTDQGVTIFAVLRNYPSLQTGYRTALMGGLKADGNKGDPVWWVLDWNGLSVSGGGMSTYQEPLSSMVAYSLDGFTLAGDLYSFRNDNDSDSVRINGASSTSSTSGPLTEIYPTDDLYAYMRIGGANGATSSQDFGGDIAEIIAYNNNISDVDRAAVEAYLADKWGISLP